MGMRRDTTNPLYLGEYGELQVQSFLRFAKIKRDQHVKEVLTNLQDFEDEKVRSGVSIARSSARNQIASQRQAFSALIG